MWLCNNERYQKAVTYYNRDLFHKMRICARGFRGSSRFWLPSTLIRYKTRDLCQIGWNVSWQTLPKLKNTVKNSKTFKSFCQMFLDATTIYNEIFFFWAIKRRMPWKMNPRTIWCTEHMRNKNQIVSVVKIFLNRRIIYSTCAVYFGLNHVCWFFQFSVEAK